MHTATLYYYIVQRGREVFKRLILCFELDDVFFFHFTRRKTRTKYCLSSNMLHSILTIIINIYSYRMHIEHILNFYLIFCNKLH